MVFCFYKHHTRNNMDETYFVDEDTFFERIFELVKNEKDFKFYVKDKSKNEPKFFKIHTSMNVSIFSFL